MITIHSSNRSPEDYETLAKFLDAGIEAMCPKDCNTCTYKDTCNELNRAIIHCLTKSGRL